MELRKSMIRAGFSGLAIAVMLLISIGAGAEEEKEREALSDDIWVERISENLWRHVSYTEFSSTGRVPANGLVVLAEGMAGIIDTPWNVEQTRTLIEWISRRFRAETTVVIPTHYHEDCLGGLAAAHQMGAVSYALDRTVTLAKRAGHEVPRNPFPDSTVVSVGALKLFLAYHGGAHTPDNIVVWIPSEKVLFGGCAVRSASSKRLGNTREAVLEEWPGTIESLMTRYGKARLIVPGHGSPGGKELLEHTLVLIRAYEP